MKNCTTITSRIFNLFRMDKSCFIRFRSAAKTLAYQKMISAGISLCLVMLTFQAQGQYCAAGGSAGSSDDITNVTFHTINNNSSVNTLVYEDFTSISTTVERGNTYAFSATISTSVFNMQIIAWIDFNQDLDFTDAGEQVFIFPSFASVTSVQSGYITIPPGATLGNTRMRVRLHRTTVGPNTTPCGNSSVGQVEDYSINIADCTSVIPDPGNTVSSVPPPVCIASGAQSFTLSLSNNSFPFVPSYQWQSSPDNITWTNISGATNATHTVSGISEVTWYRCGVINCFGTAYSNPLQMTVQGCYCTAGSTFGIQNKITNVSFCTINNYSFGTNAYEDFTSISTTVEQGNTYLFSATIDGANPGPFEILAWIDYNHDFDFDDAGEMVFDSDLGYDGAYPANITIPGGTYIGATRMRVRINYPNYGPNTTPCGNSFNTQVEDYTVILASCSSLPNPGNTTSSVAPPVCTGSGIQSFTLSMSNSTLGSFYQWQSSPDNTTWTDISGATSATYLNPGINDITWYRCFVTNCAGTAYSVPLQMTVQPCYCSAGVISNTPIQKIVNVQFNTINNTSALNSLGYEDFTNISTNIEIGGSYNLSVQVSCAYPGDQGLVWIDYNRDTDFDDPGELIYSSFFNISGGCPNTSTINTSIVIPSDVLNGTTRMRVRVHDTSTGANSTPCGTSTFGQVEDYTVNFVPCQTSYYVDTDSDGYGTGAATISCTAIAGFVTNNTDCDDTNSAVNPGATELCNNTDDNCNSIIDDGFTQYISTNVPVNISSSGTPTVTSTRVISGTTGTISDINLKDLAITHTWVGDLKGTLTSPQGTVITLFDRPGAPASSYGCGTDNLAVSFNDQTTLTATDLENTCNSTPPAISGTYQPLNPLAALNGQSANGTWTLTIQDFFAGDGGSLTGWKLEISTATTYYADQDGDGYGNPSMSVVWSCQSPGYVVNNTDCDDAISAINPGITEVCNTIDDNCNDSIDEGVLNTYYADNDGDGYGLGAPIQACTQPANTSTNDDDCNDLDNAVNPGATEVCNMIDDNCDDSIDEGVTNTYYADNDGDGFGLGAPIQACTQPANTSTNDDDCDDFANAVNPGATEVCNGGVDDNCDGLADNADPSVTGQTTWYQDADSDGLGNLNVVQMSCSQPSGYVSNSLDCNDNSTVSSCSTPTGTTVSGLTDVTATLSWAANPGAQRYNLEIKLTTASTYGPAIKVYSNTYTVSGLLPGTKYNWRVRAICDSLCSINSGLKAGPTFRTNYQAYPDTDSDGYGNSSVPYVLIPAFPAAGYSLNNLDCNDSNNTIRPNASETCNMVDDDCDVAIDEGLPIIIYYQDTDADSYGNEAAFTMACTAPMSYVINSTDCDDNAGSIYPGAPELCNNVDDDCDTGIDEGLNATWYQDADGDGLGNLAITLAQCAPPAGYVNNALDCNDGNNSPQCTLPSGQFAGPVTATTATINWTSSPCVTYYSLQYRTIPGGTWSPQITIFGNSTVLTGLAINTNYQYRIRSRCNAISTSTVWVLGSFTTLGAMNLVEEMETEPNLYTGFSVYPNPGDGIFNINMESPTETEVVMILTDGLGKVIQKNTWSLFEGQNRYQLDLINLASGVYQVQILQGDLMLTKKIVLMK